MNSRSRPKRCREGAGDKVQLCVILGTSSIYKTWGTESYRGTALWLTSCLLFLHGVQASCAEATLHVQEENMGIDHGSAGSQVCPWTSRR